MTDDDWLNALRSRGGKGPPDSPMTDGLRAAIKRDEAEGTRDGLSAAEHERILFRLRREGLLGPSRTQWNWRALAASLAVVGAIAALYPSLRGPGDAPDDRLRGSAPTVTLTAADPSALAAQVRAVLLAHDVESLLSNLENGAVELRATVPGERIAAVQAALRPLNVVLPDNGLLSIDIAKP